MAPTNRPVITPRFSVAVLLVAVVATSLGIVAEFRAWSADGPGAVYSLATYAVIGVTAIYQLLRHRRIEAVAAMAALTFCALSLTDAGRSTGFDSGYTLACLILISVVYVATRESKSVVPLLLVAGLTATYTVASIILDRPPVHRRLRPPHDRDPGAGVGHVDHLAADPVSGGRHPSIRPRRRGSKRPSPPAPRRLLTGRDEEPLAAALEALLDATEADYAYIDINRTGNEGQVTWEIVAEAMGANVPPGPDSFDEGDYSQFPQVIEVLSAGKPARIRVSDLPMPIRARYEAEGIRSELMAPVMIRDQWVGTLGYSDFWRDDVWTDVEVEGLMRAADMVGAYWERESAREGLEELAEAKDRFIATVSHELRTPLAAVVGFSGELAEGLDGYTTR